MGAAYFYHLSDTPLEATLPSLLTKARQAGWRITVRGTDAARMDWLDQKLWLLGDDGFLPHGLAGGPHDDLQPILLTTATELPDHTSCLMAVDGADVAADDIARLERVCILFDGNDPAAVDAARGQWKSLTGAGCAAQYWARDGGKWVKRAEAG